MARSQRFVEGHVDLVAQERRRRAQKQRPRSIRIRVVSVAVLVPSRSLWTVLVVSAQLGAAVSLDVQSQARVIRSTRSIHLSRPNVQQSVHERISDRDGERPAV